MASKLQITLEAMDKATADIKNVGRAIDEVKNANMGMATSSSGFLDTARMSWTELNSAVMIAKEGIGMMKGAYDAIITPTIEYADQVRDLARASGESAESTSRLIQVADDLTVSYGTLMIAARTAAKDGIEMSIDSLANLSDEYLRLQEGTERINFVTEKFGRSGLEMSKIMAQGSVKIREMSGAVNENLILTQKQIDDAKRYKESLDRLGESWEGLSQKIGTKVNPYLSDFTDLMNDMLSLSPENWFKEGANAAEKFINAFFFGQRIEEPINKLKEGLGDIPDVADTAKKAIDELSDAVSGRLSQAWTDYEGTLADLKSEEADLLTNMKDIGKDGAERTADKIANLNERMGDARDRNFEYSKSLSEAKQELLSLQSQSSGLSNEALKDNERQQAAAIDRYNNELKLWERSQKEYEKYYGEIEKTKQEGIEAEKKAHDDAQKRLEENKQKQKELQEQVQKTTNQMIYQTAVKAGYLTPGAEAQLAMDLGLIDEKSAQVILAVDKMRTTYDTNKDSLISLSEYMRTGARDSILELSKTLDENTGKTYSNQLVAVIASQDESGKLDYGLGTVQKNVSTVTDYLLQNSGKKYENEFVTRFVTKYETQGSPQENYDTLSPEMMNTIKGYSDSIKGYATGGDVYSRSPILVGERGPELFMPGSNGTVIPNNQIGGDTVIHIGSINVNGNNSQEISRNLVRALQDEIRKQQEYRR